MLSELVNIVAAKLAAADLYQGALAPAEAWRRLAKDSRRRYAKLAQTALEAVETPRLRRPRLLPRRGA